METNIICYLPLKNGATFTEETWGLIEQANIIATENDRKIAVVVHSGLSTDDLRQLPFDEIYHAHLEIEHWKVTDYHFQVFRKLLASFNHQKEIYLFSSHPLYQDLAVRAAMQSNMPIITNVMEIMIEHKSSSLLAKREIYNEKAHEFTAFSEARQQFLTFERSILYGKQQSGKPSFVQEIEIDLVNSPIRFLSESQVDWKELKITEAKAVIGIGRGVHGREAFDSILQLAEVLNAPIGGSKVADELGLIPREKRIGASGTTIEADIYVAIGISGSSQHLEGIKGVKHVIAINNDPSAAIFQRCDIGIIGDYQEVLPELVQSLQVERQSEENVEYLHIG
ncbi:electron transfer flavoprotein subunit alpha/FixB family protein [Niallia endozanthoxylica]|uniref:Electron transfer flavoprotein subunit alpha/FixB family protein n=1 Tax=Niallia endozanthoxylica TaxID=2036016 RepID=A0A5J5H8K2_9BACI|nr:electron transfer flavoprotein subunit alpha/FixB family protein [Niallia endozanthoxylica]KAA9016995.1 electron transfer flavoprotein subunit alpha/FixB family protein [Niallia endozanthoxylica]